MPSKWRLNADLILIFLNAARMPQDSRHNAVDLKLNLLSVAEGCLFYDEPVEKVFFRKYHGFSDSRVFVEVAEFLPFK